MKMLAGPNKSGFSESLWEGVFANQTMSMLFMFNFFLFVVRDGVATVSTQLSGSGCKGCRVTSK
jgi:hypothetical protein